MAAEIYQKITTARHRVGKGVGHAYGSPRTGKSSIWVFVGYLNESQDVASGLPKFLWSEAVKHAVWLRARALINKTPLEAATGERPDLSSIHEFGWKAFVRFRSRNEIGIVKIIATLTHLGKYP
jgi:hypothetical protein